MTAPERASRLAVGTAQFGLPYGVANRTGVPSASEIGRILTTAWDAGVRTLDTAPGYGDSESRLGVRGVQDWRVVTKLPAPPKGIANIRTWVRETALESMGRLRVSHLYGFLVHDPSIWTSSIARDVAAGLCELRESGLAQRVGLSVYRPDQIDAAWRAFRFDLVQIPFNVIDRRFEESGTLDALCDAGVEVHARSVFLQGLLTMLPGEHPAYFRNWERIWRRWIEWLRAEDASPVAACLNFVMARPQIACIVAGIESLSQLEGILEASSVATPLPPADLSVSDPDLVLPYRWPAPPAKDIVP